MSESTSKPEEQVQAQPDMIHQFGRLGTMMAIVVGIEFVMIALAFWGGHYLGQQTVPQAIQVEAPIVKANNEYVLNTELVVKEEQKEPARINVSLSENGNGQTVKQEQIEKLEKSLEMVRTEISHLSGGEKTSGSGVSTKQPMEKAPAPVKVSVESPPVKTSFEPKELPARAPAQVPAPEEPKKDEKTKAAEPQKTSQAKRTLSDKLGEIFSKAGDFCKNYEKSFGVDARKKWENRWTTKLGDGISPNRAANDMLIEKMMALRSAKEKGETPSQKEVYETCLLLVQYDSPTMQLPAPLLEIIGSDDEKKFQEAVNFLMLARADSK